jgi:pectate lyase
MIDLKSPFSIEHGHLTIAGQSAPGDGICLRGGGINLRADEVVLRYLRIRPGDVLGREVDGISAADCKRVVIDHCSVSWAVDEGLTVTGKSNEVTVQWCIVSECLHDSVHKKGPHSMGSLIRSQDGTYSFHHCIYAHNNTRNPRPGDNYDGSQGVLLDFRNNVLYDWGGACGYGVKERFRMNYIGNFLKAGPSTNADERQTAFHVGGAGNSLFLDGNVLEGFSEADADKHQLLAWSKDLTESEKSSSVVASSFLVPQVATSTAQEACAKVLEWAGATLPSRDAVDARIVQEIRSGTGKILNSQEEVGGWPEYHSAAPPGDRDRDGMPDDWEESHKLDPDDPSDGSLSPQGDGYTHLEDYLNSLVPPITGGSDSATY